MKILVIHGSMRKGNTYKLTQAVINRLRAKGDVTIKEIMVRDLNLPFCTSCHTCFARGEHLCPHYKVVGEVAKELDDSDGIILTGVVYAMQLNAAMKNLIDHLAYLFHRPRLFNKKGLIISTTAGAGEKAVAKYLKDTMGIWGVNGILMLSEKIQTATFSLTPAQTKRVEDTADSLYDRILSKKSYPVTLNQLSIYSAFRGMSTASNQISAYDNAYWSESGLKDKAYPLKINPFQKAYGGLTCFILRKVIDKNVQKQELSHLSDNIPIDNTQKE